MNINWQTKNKANEIQTLIKQGYTQKDILEKKFGRSKRKMKEHLETAKEIYSKHELDVLTTPYIPNNTLKETDNLYKITKLLSDKANLDNLNKLIKNADNLLNLLNDKDSKNIKLLIIPEEMLKYDDIKSKSIRISEGILKEFDDFCNKNKLYSKTALYNYALKEFIEKYNK